MPLETLLISGPSGCGKTTVAQVVADHVLGRSVHILRLQTSLDNHTNSIEREPPDDTTPSDGRWASVHIVRYTRERIFETLPDALRAVRRLDRRGFVIVEADTDPSIRHAYPYDYRVFVMSSPVDIHEVFREPKAAAVALQEVMEDTAAFAAEIFGLFEGDPLDDSSGVKHRKKKVKPRRGSVIPTPVEFLDVNETQIHQFLRSPIGAEIASRIQLQPEFHALVEADVVLVNMGRVTAPDVLDECVRRIEKLLSRIRHDSRQHSILYWGDLTCDRDPTRCMLIERLKTLIGK
ncbi:MAG TPA: hypothetical protein PKY77_15750 [Phycisphaerae bacterium]|nr:hypothetical protein [Phycisphaerae bacterium]HRY70710.1 hypothetical protein [Phycisphaerae bacterium]HSA28744.1 hypothetical protein [Phycisphaerae bacterium]